MKIFLMLGLSFLSQITWAQSREEVLTAAEKFRLAMLSEDHETLRTLTSKDLSYGHSSGLIENQEEFLKVFETKSQDYQVWDVSDFWMNFHGENLAMVRYNVHAEIANSTNVSKLDLGLLMVWIKEDGSWKLLARQAFRKPGT
ncbi:nuclear transport factor 2 family protein [Algoriphagus mannitolivorans]|uniref:nuclear transport factor 2 family protein n=1 Tax=Algoriphagus mannitolivorans TaxID=226504 RepID=UPI00047D2DFF|nr:nuclear transport factor 2 family protein [Algoriphagus mannitolivorans]